MLHTQYLMPNTPYRLRAYTLTEVLISVALIALIAALSIPSFLAYLGREDLDSSAKSLVATLREAQARSATAENGSAWGVRFSKSAKNYFLAAASGGAVTGAPARVAALKSNLELSYTEPDIKDVTFNTVTGAPSSAASVVVRLAADQTALRTITVYANGRIEEQ